MSRKQFKKSVLATFSGFVRTIHLDMLVLIHQSCSKFLCYDHCIWFYEQICASSNVSVHCKKTAHGVCSCEWAECTVGTVGAQCLVGAASVGKIGCNTHAEPLGTSAPRSPWTPIWPTSSSSFSWIWMSYIFSTGANIGDGDSTGQCCCCARHLVLYQLTHKLWPFNTSPPNIAPGFIFFQARNCLSRNSDPEIELFILVGLLETVIWCDTLFTRFVHFTGNLWWGVIEALLLMRTCSHG